MRDNEIAASQHLALRDVLHDPNVLRLRPEHRGVDLLAHRRHHVDRQPSKRVEDATIEFRSVEDGAEREVHGRPGRLALRLRRGCRPEAERLPRQRSGGAPEARRERGEHESALEHGENRVCGETVFVAQRMQRLGDNAPAQESSGSKHDDADAWKSEPLSRDGRAEIDFVADHEVGLPRPGELEDRRSVSPGATTREVLAEILVLPVRVNPVQRRRGRRPGARLTRGERCETGGADCSLEIARTGNCDGVAGALRGDGDGDQRMEMTDATGEREEHSHHSSVWA